MPAIETPKDISNEHLVWAGIRRPDGDWPGASDPGGCECAECGCIFIGDEWRSKCKVCATTSR